MDTDMQGGRGPTAVSDTEVLEGLNDLLQLDHDAVGAYDIAIDRLEDRDHADQIRGFKADHERHIRELNEMIQALGGTPTNEPHATGPFKQGMQALGALGGDKGTLIAWRTNENQVRAKYESYASRANAWPAEVKRLIDENALDEERHYRWVSDVLQTMGVGGSEGGMAERMREQVSGVAARVQELPDQARERVQELSGQARERVGAAMGSARERAAGGLDSAAQRLDDVARQQETAGGARARLAGAARGVSTGLEGTAELLRSGDAEQLRSDLEEQVRTKPVQTLLMTFAVGFVIGRILR